MCIWEWAPSEQLQCWLNRKLVIRGGRPLYNFACFVDSTLENEWCPTNRLYKRRKHSCVRAILMRKIQIIVWQYPFCPVLSPGVRKTEERFTKRAFCKFLKLTRPIPPSSLGFVTWCHPIRCICLPSSLWDQMKLWTAFSILLMVAAGTRLPTKCYMGIK